VFRLDVDMTGYNLFKNKVIAFRVKNFISRAKYAPFLYRANCNELTVCLWRQTAVSERPSTALSAMILDRCWSTRMSLGVNKKAIFTVSLS
jgi:hypothetical protein